jgi:phosphoglycolate phosphatase
LNETAPLSETVVAFEKEEVKWIEALKVIYEQSFNPGRIRLRHPCKTNETIRRIPMSATGLLIFDMDGTLIDSMPQHTAAFSRILHEEYQVPEDFSKQEYLNTAGKPVDEQFRHVLRLSGHCQPGSVTDLIDRFWVLVQESEPTVFPDVPSAVERLWHAGYILVVISGCAPSVVEAKMRKAGVSKYFKLMLGTDYGNAGMTKGEGHFRFIRDELRLDMLQFQLGSALVGDGEHDMIIAKKAGIVAIGRLTGGNSSALAKAGADYLIKSLDELVSILQTLSKPNRFLPVSHLRKE